MRPLREIKIRTIVFHAKDAKSVKFLFTFLFNAGAEGVANFVTTRVRREFIHPPCGVLPPVSGGEPVTTEYHCASRLSPRDRWDERSVATEGVDSFHLSVFTFPFIKAEGVDVFHLSVQ